MSKNTLDVRPGALVTSELSLPAAAASSSLLGPVTSLCHILFSQALPPSPSVSAKHWPRNTELIQQWPRSILGEFLYTGRNKRFKFEFQSLTLVSGHQKPSQRLWDPSQLPLLPPFLPSSSSSPSSFSHYWGWPRNPPALTVPILLAAGGLSLCLPEWPWRNEVPWSHHAKPIVFTLMHTV